MPYPRQLKEMRDFLETEALEHLVVDRGGPDGWLCLICRLESSKKDFPQRRRARHQTYCKLGTILGVAE